VLAGLLRGLAPHLVRHRLAGKVQQAIDVKVVGGLQALSGFRSVSRSI
jgi:hypothetical protein